MPAKSRPADIRRLISLAEAAELADVNVRSIRRYISDGRIAAYRVGPKLLKVAAADVEKLIQPVTIAG